MPPPPPPKKKKKRFLIYSKTVWQMFLKVAASDTWVLQILKDYDYEVIMIIMIMKLLWLLKIMKCLTKILRKTTMFN